MTTGIGSFSDQQAVGQHHGQQTTNLPAANSSAMASEVSDLCGAEPTGMTDEEREAAAYRAGVAMQAWYSRYQQTGDRQALSIAHRHMTQMVAILAKQCAEGRVA